MKRTLLRYLICPYCKNDLSLKEFSDGEDIREGILICKCKRKYPIIDYIPRMLPDFLRREIVIRKYGSFVEKYGKDVLDDFGKSRDENIDKDKLKTIKNFSYQWSKFPSIYEAYKQQFLDFIYPPVTPEYFKDKLVLDAGCGIGRHAYIAADMAKEVVCFDIGESIDVAYQNLKGKKNVHLVQADMNYPPFKKVFDYVYCIGVLHHLKDPLGCFEKLVSLAKKDASISIWVYGKENNLLLILFNPARKYFLTKLPPWMLEKISLLTTISIYPFLMLVYKPLNAFNPTKKIAKYLPQNDFFFYLSKFDFRIIHLIVFDQMAVPISLYCERKEVEGWFKKLKLKNVMITSRNNNSWRGYGQL